MAIHSSVPPVVWEDLATGESYELGRFRIDAAQHRVFCAAFDPDHMLSQAAAASPMFLTARLMRAIVDGYLGAAAGLGAGGVARVAWPDPETASAPVGSELVATMTCTGSRLLQSRPGVGLANLAYSLADAAAGAVVLEWEAVQFLATRDRTFDATPMASPDRRPGVATAVAADDVALGTVTFARQAVLAFAARYDPQAFHLDDAAAARSLFGALCASGWHTCAVWHRLLRDHLTRSHAFARFAAASDAEASASAVRIVGLRDLKWLRPVYAGETVTFAMQAPAADTMDAVTCMGTTSDGHRVFEVTALLG